MNGRLYRSTRNRILGGVCSGIAEYTNIDRRLLRILAFVSILVMNVIPGLIAYGICCLVLPTDIELLGEGANDTNNFDSKPHDPEKTRMVIGVALILIGMIALLKLLFNWLDFRYLFPVLLVIFGAYLIYKNSRGKQG